ncbi:hypothetical protein Agub_g6953 [Astrephomene gubernaculifera]|uniref:Fungal lipase-type domain-containing protein n=1 Tax=Astrephomene gubernaculifera TaxID=47775 RepID=A0AAD3HLB8_9CHLO|nr:hypothetical protein Agub_g6953 [Astrephomene gubernaculifera]
MVIISLSCTVTAQETTASSLKPSVFRTSLAPQKGPRRSLDSVCAHVLATHVNPPDSHVPAGIPSQTATAIAMEAAPVTHWTPTWTKTLQTKFLAVWESWQKLSGQISQYKALRPDWVATTQELLDQQFQRFLSSVGAAASARSTSTAAPKPLPGDAEAEANRPVTLTPYLTVADEVEISFAAMLADLCNMAYEVDKLDPELLEARHRLSLIASSLTSTGSCTSSMDAAAAILAAEEGDAEPEADGAAVQQDKQQRPQQQRRRKAAAASMAEEHEPMTPGIVSFTMGGSPPLTPAISMLQLTSPEAVTAALTSQGHGAAFAHPVYVSSLHHGLTTSLGSGDEEGDVSDSEWRAAMAAAGERGVILNRAMGGSLGTMGSMGTWEDFGTPLSEQHVTQQQQYTGRAIGAAEKATGRDGIVAELPRQSSFSAGGVLSVVPSSPEVFLRRSASAPATFYSDVNLNEERDFVPGQLYGYMTPLVERRGSIDGSLGVPGSEDDDVHVLPVAAVAQSGAAGGRALRAKQEQQGGGGRRRRSMSDSGVAQAAAVPAAAVAAAVVAGGMDGAVDGAVDSRQEEGDMAQAVAGGPPVVVASTKAPPNAWFSCDDKLSKTRYFAIQGSTSLEHWQINLQFEPVIFEDPKFGVRIHRGVYEAAKVLYRDLLPLVQQHLETSPFATVSFTGHSLGGSLATVLMLLFVIRGVLKPSNISPNYTFGSPAIFCKGAVPNAPEDRCSQCKLTCDMRAAGNEGGDQDQHHNHHFCEHHHGARTATNNNTSNSNGGASRRNSNGGNKSANTATAAAASSPPSAASAAASSATSSVDQPQVLPLGLLAQLGLSEDHVVNIIMHKDIVPRAFVCDYTHLAGMLHRWWPALRAHREHHQQQLQLEQQLDEQENPDSKVFKSLYNFVGRMAVLRPSPDLPFINGPSDASHPMLPNRPALYRVGIHEDAPLSVLDHEASSFATWDDIFEGFSTVASRNRRGGARGGGASAAADAKRAAQVASMQSSMVQFMNQPHPLATLSEYGAYGPNGCISRFHNPDNYTRALAALLDR